MDTRDVPLGNLSRNQEITDLYRKYAPKIRAFIRSLGCPAGDVDDVLHEIFMKVMEVDDSPINSWEGFLIQCARNAALDLLRKLRRERGIFALACDLEACAFDEGRQEDDRLDEIMMCLEQLSKRDREVFVYCRLHGNSRLEAVEHFGIKLSTVDGIMYRADGHIRETLGITKMKKSSGQSA